jgi:hypothetical protein
LGCRAGPVHADWFRAITSWLPTEKLKKSENILRGAGRWIRRIPRAQGLQRLSKGLPIFATAFSSQISEHPAITLLLFGVSASFTRTSPESLHTTTGGSPIAR